MRVFTGVLSFFICFHAQASGIQFDATVSEGLRNQVKGDLALMDGIRMSRSSRLHDEIFGIPNRGMHLDWFTSRVSFFGFSDCGGSGGAVACVQVRNTRKIWVTRNYVEIEHPQIARIMTLFHEARHTEAENRNWPHSRCPLFFKEKSIWTGKSLNWHYACDRTEYGSYSSASVLLNNVSRFCVNCTDKLKLDATIYSKDQAKRITKRSAWVKLMRDLRD